MGRSFAVNLFFGCFPLLSFLGGANLKLTVFSSLRLAMIHYFAAGIVFMVAALELLPKVVGALKPWSMLLGIGMALALMGCGIGRFFLLSLKQGDNAALPLFCKQSGRNNGSGQIAQQSLSLFLDGFVLSLTFVASLKAGMMLACALMGKALVEGVAVSEKQLQTLPRARGARWLLVQAVFMEVGVSCGFVLLQIIPTAATTFILAFAMIVVLYQMIESVLAEARFVESYPRLITVFFIGAVIMLFLDTIV